MSLLMKEAALGAVAKLEVAKSSSKALKAAAHFFLLALVGAPIKSKIQEPMEVKNKFLL